MLTLYDVAETVVARHICVVLKDLENEEGVIPSPLIQAILLYVGDLYNSREGNSYGVNVSQVPFSYDYILSLYKNYADTTSEDFYAKALDKLAQGLYIDKSGDLKSNVTTPGLEGKVLDRMSKELYIDENGDLQSSTTRI